MKKENAIPEANNNLTAISDPAEIKRLLLDILRFIREVCEKNGIRYYLAYGTLLGAIRHNGFIPWDDDVDIFMPRPDFNRFVSLLSGSSGHYRILTPLQKDYYYNFGKVVDTRTVLLENGHRPIENMGIYIDIFPLDGMPDNREEREKMNRELIRIRRKISAFGKQFPRPRKNILKYLSSIRHYVCCRFSKLADWQQEYLDAVSQFDYNESKYVYVTGGSVEIEGGLSSIFPVKWFENTAKVLFEGEYYSAPADYEEMLRQLYGDYMTLPPREKQISVHDYSVYYKHQAEKAD